MSRNFPFTAVVGQDHIKTAMMLVAIDPKLGGLLVSGPRGSAKSTLVRGFEDILTDSPFVTLPLGATEEMITGSFNLKTVLQSAEIEFQPGLLNRADQGLLYVDEVNLLADHLVDLLLDSAASGISIVERDGISHQQSTQFSLIGTMNPDEGELRPQLLDRFGLMAVVSGQYTLDQRKQVAERRIAFDTDPELFAERYRKTTDAITKNIQRGRSCLNAITLSKTIRDEIAKRCDQAGVDGFRADITLLRAARAQAALRGHKRLRITHIDAVEALVFSHRVPDNQPPPPPSSNTGNCGSGSSSSSSDPAPENSGSSIQGAWGAAPHAPLSNNRLVSSPQIKFKNRINHHPNSSVANTRLRGGSESRQFISEIRSGDSNSETRKPDWRRTVANMRQVRRWKNTNTSFKDCLEYKFPVKRTRTLDMVLLDSSASTFSGDGFSLARQVIQNISRQCYLQRRYICVVGFANDQVKTVLLPQRAPKNLDPFLQSIPIGGGTPAEQAFDCVQRMLGQQKYQFLDCQLFLITDGRIPSRSTQHSLLQKYPVTVVDIESGKIRLGLSKDLAATINADYLHV